VETREEALRYAAFLRENHGKFDGVILCLPNFGDETGALVALGEAGVPILIQAYPDELDKMAPESRRDAFCGKFSVMDVFTQSKVPFTALVPHVVHPQSETFAANVDTFDRLCRVVGGLKSLVVGAIGARPAAFKTVRIDELALQRHGITVETFDMADILARMRGLSNTDFAVKNQIQQMKEYCAWQGVPQTARVHLAKLGVVLNHVIEQHHLDAIAVRCWLELQKEFDISPCVLLGMMNETGPSAACEVDVGSAVMMRALQLASGRPAACLDWNNNYGDEQNKCVLFHCGPVPRSLMAGPGRVTQHAILANAVGKPCGWGCHVGRIAPMPMTFGNLMTEGGRIKTYVDEGRFTEDPIPDDFFGCAGVAEIPDLQRKLQTLGYLGHRHHTNIAPGHVAEPLAEAFEKYLDFEVARL